MSEYDAETNAQLNRAQAIEAMLGSAGWKFAEEDLLEVIGTLRDIRNIDLKADPGMQVTVNLATAESLELWLEDLKSQVNNAIIVDSTESNPLMDRR